MNPVVKQSSLKFLTLLLIWLGTGKVVPAQDDLQLILDDQVLEFE